MGDRGKSYCRSWEMWHGWSERPAVAVCGAVVTGVLTFGACLLSLSVDANAASASGDLTRLTFGRSQQQSACAPPRVMTRSDKNSGALESPLRIKPLGEIRGIMLFVDFPDASASSTTQALYDDLVRPSQEWFRSTSQGRMALVVTAVHRWLRMPRSSSSYGVTRANLSFENQRRLMADAIAAADAEVDFRGYQLIYVVAADSAVDYSPGFTAPSAQWGLTADGNTFVNGALFGRDIHDWYPHAPAATFVHETLHTFGLPDLWHFGNVPPQSMDFVGGWSIMSAKMTFPGILAWERLQLGWLDASQVACIDQPAQSDIVLTPLELQGGVKAVIVKQRTGRFVVGEVRIATAEDAALCDSGFLVYTVDPAVEDGQGSIRVQPAAGDDGSRDTASCSLYYRAAYRPERATHAAFESGHLTFTLLAQGGTNSLVRAACSAVVCAEQPAAPTPAPPRQPTQTPSAKRTNVAARRVSLTITSDFVALGRVRSARTRCAQKASVSIQARHGASWRVVGATRTRLNGQFRMRLNRRPGVYRAFLRAQKRCGRTFSPPVRRR